MPDASSRDFIALQAAALFRFDARGRITGTNEPDPSPAPRLFLGRTSEGNIWRFGHQVSDELAAELDAILHREPITAQLEHFPECFAALVQCLESDAPIASVWSGPAWVIPADVPHSSDIETTSDLDPSLLSDALPIFASDLAPMLPYAAVVAAGRIASVCSCARITDAVAEAGLHTMEEHRGRGYAAAVTAAWAAAVRATGRVPLYSTSWDNAASRRAAAKLGLTLYGADLSIG